MSESQTRAIAGQAIVGTSVTGVEEVADPTMPNYNADSFEWEGACWELVTDPDLDIALIRPGGDPGLQEQFAARLANILRLNVENLYVTDTAVINEAVVNRLFVDMFAANKIGADEIAANSIDVSKLRVTAEMSAQIGNFLEINAEQVNGGSFSGETFTGGSFYGSQFIGGSYATSRYPGSDGGVMIDETNGLRAWSPSGTLSVQISPDDGRLKAVNSSGRGVILIPTTSTGGGGLWFSHTGGGGGSDAAIWRSSYDTNAREPLNLRGANDAGIRVSGGINMVSGIIEGEGAILTGGSVFGDMTHINPPTTSAGANALIATSPAGRFYKSTSSRRYKKNIVDWNPEAERVLSLQPRQWQHDDKNFPDDIDETWHVGFVAEEVHDVGLRQLVKYMGDGKGGWIPDGLNYDRFAAAQQIVLQKHEAEIQELRARIDALESE